MNNVTKLRPFTRFCMTIGMLPTSYKMSLTYEEQILWLCKYLEDTIIPAINNNAEAVTEVQNLYNELKLYVDNYFDNLDIQEEINNKLDEMAESGELAEIISEYIEMQGLLCYNSTEEMKNATNLVEGSFAKTYGFYNYNDKGGALYKIRKLINTDVIDNKKIIALTNDNTLVAEIIINDKIYVEQIGAIENTDILSILNYVFNTFDVPVYLQKDYTLSDNITIDNKILNLNSNKITSDNKAITLINVAEITGGTLYNTKLIISTGKNKAHNLTIKDWTGNAIDILNGAYECKLDYINLENDTTDGDIGINCLASDNYIQNVYGYGATVGIYISGADNYFKNIHLWLNHNNDFENSVFAQINTSDNFIIDSTIDSYKVGIEFLQTYLNLVLENCNWINNNILFNNTTFNIINSLSNCIIKGLLYIKATNFVANNNFIVIGDTSELDIFIQDSNENIDKVPSIGKSYLDSHITPANSLCFGELKNNKNQLSGNLTIFAPSGLSTPPSSFDIDLSRLLNIDKNSNTYFGVALYKSGSSTALAIAQAKFENSHLIVSKPNGINYNEGMWEFRITF